ncbi:glycosyltransferase [Pseudomonas frederiksbergensis]|uniref:glycosyltransferase n=1 Tax=Pseudomonas frederiksbergensis TaxID=104087 RepID=UPI003D2211F0
MLKIGNALISETVKFYVDDTATCIIADDVQIRDNVVIECGAGGFLSISSGTVVNYGAWINGSGKVTIGANVLIAPNVSITSSTHRYDRKISIKDQGLKLAEVIIEDDAWIGANTSVLAGAVVGKGVVVAANSVVKFNIEPQSIAAGSPAVRVAQRKFKKVVFYTLPLVLRGRPTLFSSIVDVYLPLANKFASEGWECIFVGSDELKNEYGVFAHQWVSPATFSCVYPNGPDVDWLGDWTAILKKEAVPYHDDFVRRMVSELDPDLVFCWNYDGSLDRICSSHTIPLIFNELGMLREPNAMGYYSDPQGVNARSAFRTEFAAYLERVQTYDNSGSVDRLKALEGRYKYQGGVREPNALVLLQVQDDSNVIMGSPYSSMAEYVQHVSDVISGSGLKIIVKPHPLDSIPPLPEHVFVAGKEDNISDLISAADVVFTLNSSAGFEAALAGKPVYVLGLAPYSGLGLTIDVREPADLISVWQAHQTDSVCSSVLRASILDFAETQYFLSAAQFCEPSVHLARLRHASESGFERNLFDPDLESYRQQSYISWLESKNKEINADLALLNQELFQVKGQLFEVEAQLDALQATGSKLGNSEEKNSFFKGEVFSMGHSIISFVKRCLAGLRRLVSSPKAVLRPLYQKFPFLASIRVRIGLYSKSLRAKLISVIYSKDNIKAIQVITDRRFSHVLVAPTVSAQPVVDISIVTYNSVKWVDGFFESLKSQSYPLGKLYLYFVDNGSSDSTVEALERWKVSLGAELAGFEVLRGDNVGFGAGHDRAIGQGDAEYFLVSNIDITFAGNSIEKIISSALSGGQENVASWELRQAPYEHPKYYDPVTLETNWSSHACILIRRSAYVKVGGYESQIFMYGEDVELSYRFRSYGYRLKYCPSAVVYHYTYEHENHVKPIQYAGSTLANAYIRLRYGRLTDKWGGIVLQLLLFMRPQAYPGSRRDLMRNIAQLTKKASYFLGGKGPDKDAYFPFRGFDYELIRDGAFWRVGEPLVGQPLVTIVTRTYQKRDEFLRQSIMSVFNQTYRNIELIVVEDGGSTMKALVSEMQCTEGRRVSFYGLEKVGRSVTGNYGLEVAKGKYCMFLDDDDLLFSDHVEVLVAALLKNDTAVAAYSLAMEVGTVTDDTNGRYTEVSHETHDSFKHEYDYDVLLDHNFIPIQSLLFKRDLYLKRGGFETDMSNLEDWNLWLRYGYENEFCYVPKTTSLFRTPADPKIRLSRHKQLHEAYFVAKNRAMKSCEDYV